MTTRERFIEIAEEFYRTPYTSPQRESTNKASKSQIHKLINQGSKELPDITLEEVRLSLREIKNNKASGEDQIVIKAVKMGGEGLLRFAVSLFNLGFKNSIILSK